MEIKWWICLNSIVSNVLRKLRLYVWYSYKVKGYDIK